MVSILVFSDSRFPVKRIQRVGSSPNIKRVNVDSGETLRLTSGALMQYKLILWLKNQADFTVIPSSRCNCIELISSFTRRIIRSSSSIATSSYRLLEQCRQAADFHTVPLDRILNSRRSPTTVVRRPKMDAKSPHGEKSRKPFKSRNLTCPVNYYRCERCLKDDFPGCCPIGSSCMCRDGFLDACETI